VWCCVWVVFSGLLCGFVALTFLRSGLFGQKGATLGVVLCVGRVWGCYMGVIGFISNFALFASSFYLIKHPQPLETPILKGLRLYCRALFLYNNRQITSK